MITSVFNKSKPINYIIVFFMLVIAFVITLFKHQNGNLNSLKILELGFNFVLVLLSLFTVTFIIKKNSLTEDNNFTSFCFALFVLLVPQVFLDVKLLLANLLVLLAFRRLASISSNRNTIKKLLDSGVLIAVASLFFSWSIAFILLSFVAIIYHQEKKGSHFLVPVIGVSLVAVIAWVVNLYFLGYLKLNLNVNASVFNFDSYNSFQFISSITLIIVFGLWTTFFFINNITKRKRILWPSYKLVVLFLLLSSITFLFTELKTGSELLFLIAPFSIISANYFQNKNDKWFKEIILILWILVILVNTFMS